MAPTRLNGAQICAAHTASACLKPCHMQLRFTSRNKWLQRSSGAVLPQALPGNDKAAAATQATAAPAAPAADSIATGSKNTPTAAAPQFSSSSSGGGFLSTLEQQSTAFLMLSVTSVAFGVAALAAPRLLLAVAVGSNGTELEIAFTRVAGATMAISAAVEYSLRDAVIAGHLKSATYQRLILGVIAKSSAYAAALLMSPELWNPVLLSFYPTAAAASIVINAATLRSAFQQAGATSLAAGLAAAAGGLKLPQTAAAWTYSLFILLYLATVAACYVPEVIFTGQAMTPAGLLLKHTWAPGFLLAAVACLVLADAADRGRLGATTFRRLNLGLAALEAGYAAVFGAAIVGGLAVNDGSSWSNLAGSVGIAGYCLWQYLSTGSQSKA